MTNDNSQPQGEADPVGETTQADKQDAERGTDEPAPPPVVQSLDVEGGEPQPAETYDETDRKQDETLNAIAQQTQSEVRQTELMERQTVWIRRQAIWTIALTAATLGVLVYHGWIMGRQTQAMTEQTGIMQGQLKSMQEDSAQTQQMIEASKRSADASQSIAEQNRELTGHAGEQAKASLAQAEAAKQSVGAAQASAKAAERGAQIAQESFYIGDRPYITAKNAVLEKFEADIRPRVAVLFINTGKTPAIDLKIGAVVSIARTPKPDMNLAERQTASDLVYPSMPEGSSIILPSGGEMPAVAQGLELLSKATVEEIKNGKMYLFVWGGAYYKDALGKPHSLRFCQFYDPNEEMFVACPTFNDTK